jgi:hypothetical protein
MRNCRVLTADEMARISGVSADYLKLCIKAGYITPLTHAADDVVPKGGEEKLAQEAARSFKQFIPTMRMRPAEETFKDFWDSVSGKQRLMNPRTINEVMNVAKGYPAAWRSERNDKNVDNIMADVVHEVEKTGTLNAESYLNATDGKSYKRAAGRPRKQPVTSESSSETPVS